MFKKLFKTRKEYVTYRRQVKQSVEKIALNRVKVDGKKRLKLTYTVTFK